MHSAESGRRTPTFLVIQKPKHPVEAGSVLHRFCQNAKIEPPLKSPRSSYLPRPSPRRSAPPIATTPYLTNNNHYSNTSGNGTPPSSFPKSPRPSYPPSITKQPMTPEEYAFQNSLRKYAGSGSRSTPCTPAKCASPRQRTNFACEARTAFCRQKTAASCYPECFDKNQHPMLSLQDYYQRKSSIPVANYKRSQQEQQNLVNNRPPHPTSRQQPNLSKVQRVRSKSLDREPSLSKMTGDEQKEGLESSGKNLTVDNILKDCNNNSESKEIDYGCRTSLWAVQQSFIKTLHSQALTSMHQLDCVGESSGNGGDMEESPVGLGFDQSLMNVEICVVDEADESPRAAEEIPGKVDKNQDKADESLGKACKFIEKAGENPEKYAEGPQTACKFIEKATEYSGRACKNIAKAAEDPEKAAKSLRTVVDEAEKGLETAEKRQETACKFIEKAAESRQSACKFIEKAAESRQSACKFIEKAAESRGTACKFIEKAAESHGTACKFIEKGAESRQSACKFIEKAAESRQSACKFIEKAAESRGTACKFIEKAAESRQSACKFIEKAAESRGTACKFIEKAAESRGTACKFIEKAAESRGTACKFIEKGAESRGAACKFIKKPAESPEKAAKSPRTVEKIVEKSATICCNCENLLVSLQSAEEDAKQLREQVEFLNNEVAALQSFNVGLEGNLLDLLHTKLSTEELVGKKSSLKLTRSRIIQTDPLELAQTGSLDRLRFPLEAFIAARFPQDTGDAHNKASETQFIKCLKIAIAARDGLLGELSSKIKAGIKTLTKRSAALEKASQLDGNGTPSLTSAPILHSYGKFIRFIYTYLEFSLSDMNTFDNDYIFKSEGTDEKHFYNKRVKINGVSRSGIFIPIAGHGPEGSEPYECKEIYSGSAEFGTQTSSSDQKITILEAFEEFDNFIGIAELFEDASKSKGSSLTSNNEDTCCHVGHVNQVEFLRPPSQKIYEIQLANSQSEATDFLMDKQKEDRKIGAGVSKDLEDRRGQSSGIYATPKTTSKSLSLKKSCPSRAITAAKEWVQNNPCVINVDLFRLSSPQVLDVKISQNIVDNYNNNQNLSSPVRSTICPVQ